MITADRSERRAARSASSASTAWTWASSAAGSLSKHNIVTTPMVTDEFTGMRITPNVYTTVDEVDLFADRVIKAIRQGVA